MLKEHYCKTFVKIPSQIEIKAYFHFSHYKSMETLSCHSNENHMSNSNKNTLYVEANINILSKLQLHPPDSFSEETF